MKGQRRWLITVSVAIIAAATTGAIVAQGQPSTAAPGSIAGRVVLEESGKAVEGATVAVFARERPPAMDGNWIGVQTVTTGKDGSYLVSKLPPREYLLCAAAAPSAATADLLPGCQWGRRPWVVIVRAGRAMTGEDLAIERGRVLELEVKDPGDQLEKNEVKGRGVHLLVGVWGPDGRFRDARIAERGKGARRYEVLVPFDTDVRLEVKGRKLDLADDKGKAKKEDDVPELVREAKSASKVARRFVVEVKGVKP